MKTNKIIKILIVLMVILIAGCGFKYEVKTTVYADGSCQRTLFVTYEDSIDKFFENEYPIPIDSTWSLVIEQDTNENGDTVFVHKASKLFDNVEQLNQLYKDDSSQYNVIGRSVELTKRFRWFYTFLDYKESYPKLFDQPKLNTYLDSTHFSYAMLSDDEQEEYLDQLDSITAKKFESVAEDGFNKWLEYTIYNSCLDAVEKSAANIKSWPINEAEFSNKRDSINHLISGELAFFDDDKNIFEAVKRVFELDTVLFEELKNQNSFRTFINEYKLWESILTEEDHINSVEMPGLVIETSSNSLTDANEVQWNVDWMKYFTDDYVMYAQSRIINIWTFWVSGGFIILLFFIILLRRVIKNRK